MVNFVMLDKTSIKVSSKPIGIGKGNKESLRHKTLIRMTNFHQFSIYEISQDSKRGML